MNFKKWISTIAASALIAATFTTSSVVQAEETSPIADETIYDVLVDRYFNGTNVNDFKVDVNNLAEFAGGDFKGMVDQFDLISGMGFSIVSLGSIFATETYNGTMVTSYSKIEPQFGTEEEFTQLVEFVNQKKVDVMIDFPISNVSENHEWVSDPAKANWVAETANGKVRWDLKNEEVQTALIEAVENFITTYNIGGVRLTNLDNADTSFLNKMIDAIKEAKEGIYVISNEQSDANFDATYYEETNEAFRNVYKNVDQDSSNLLTNVETFAQKEGTPTQLMIDHLNKDRFVFDVELFPPTRLKLSLATALLLPGVPVVQYGTEIAMNGEAGPESHQIYNFKTDKELVDFITNIQTLRSQSETLRRGDFKLVKNENGLLVFERSSDEERWIVIINNTGVTTRVDFTEEELGKDKEVRGMLETDVIRADDNGVYPIVIDREVVEVYQVIDEIGFNIKYLILLAIVYIVFIGFIIAVVKKSRRNKNKAAQ
ncbi:alpha-amylase family glycosyl hydrolase [Lysinibacillus sp. BW-2-10]|uniref:alpha-amylase family glycosyl hydrolase n=1 Tax=Lysinibacillus sp. BW-2-10 TaxID=2590030 RepID=UPI0011810651|nr:alpha-amylase family glycosyl hydrolase [Lysinibacillus sp. BW-2-10]TSI04249.1 alpha-amlyase [Lysinibacillus sp. BW-2-10]